MSSASLSVSGGLLAEATAALRLNGQSDLLAHLKSLGLEDSAQETLSRQILGIRWDLLKNKFEKPALLSIEAPSVITLQSLVDSPETAQQYVELGKAAYRNGEVAVVIMAGGLGTRLGCSGPKGCLPCSPVSDATLYQMLAEKALHISKSHGLIKLIFITSEATDAATRDYFKKNKFFNLDPEQVLFQKQGLLPVLHPNGAVALASRDQILEAPDGHGGVFDALKSSGALGRLERDGVRHLLFSFVDNPLAPLFDPLAIGARISQKADMLTKVWHCEDPSLSVGRMVKANGVDQMLEYVDMTSAAADRDTLNPALKWANATRHVIGLDVLLFKASEGFNLPIHLSKKTMNVFHGDRAVPTEVMKPELFIFDLIPQVSHTTLEALPGNEYAPIKDKTGIRSPHGAKVLMHQQACRWIEAAGYYLEDLGVKANPEANGWAEISPSAGASKEEFADLVEKDKVTIRSLDSGVLFSLKN